MHAKGSGAFGTFTVTHDITKYTRVAIFSEVGKKAEMFARFSTVAGERGAAWFPTGYTFRVRKFEDAHPRSQSGQIE